jgi:hypothetical protein
LDQELTTTQWSNNRFGRRSQASQAFYFYAIVADFPHARSVPLLQTKIFGFDELAPQSVQAVPGKRVDRKASNETCKAADLSE